MVLSVPAARKSPLAWTQFIPYKTNFSTAF